MSRLLVSERAEDDLNAITAYIAEESGRLRAVKAVARIRKAMDSLALMPGMGGRRHYLDPDFRMFPVPPWLVVYEPLPLAGGVRIMRIIDGRRDVPAIFGKKKR
ncbi:MAG TPA: type II toxin-antitoxin system RelE/ParE family toxin [Rhizomicrobium sp.]|nr:type II toxin-antitoxin system RelE/ParE family toxin [Rhizomicrobium sp.]